MSALKIGTHGARLTCTDVSRRSVGVACYRFSKLAIVAGTVQAHDCGDQQLVEGETDDGKAVRPLESAEYLERHS